MTTIVSVASRWRLTPAESEILWIMHRKAEYVSIGDFAVYTGRPHQTEQDHYRTDKTIRVLLTRLRKKLPKDSIKSKYGVGYKLVNPKVMDVA